MSITLDLPPELEIRLEAEARKWGLHAPEYALRLIQGQLGSADVEDEFDALLDSLPDNRALAGLPPLTDEQISRASFYEDED